TSAPRVHLPAARLQPTARLHRQRPTPSLPSCAQPPLHSVPRGLRSLPQTAPLPLSHEPAPAQPDPPGSAVPRMRPTTPPAGRTLQPIWQSCSWGISRLRTYAGLTSIFLAARAAPSFFGSSTVSTP